MAILLWQKPARCCEPPPPGVHTPRSQAWAWACAPDRGGLVSKGRTCAHQDMGTTWFSDGISPGNQAIKSSRCPGWHSRTREKRSKNENTQALPWRQSDCWETEKTVPNTHIFYQVTDDGIVEVVNVSPFYVLENKPENQMPQHDAASAPAAREPPLPASRPSLPAGIFPIKSGLPRPRPRTFSAAVHPDILIETNALDLFWEGCPFHSPIRGPFPCFSLAPGPTRTPQALGSTLLCVCLQCL